MKSIAASAAPLACLVSFASFFNPQLRPLDTEGQP